MSEATLPTDPKVIFTLTLLGEAENTGVSGMQHVASVILNRARIGGWWGHDVRSVCLAPWQFSCWNPGPDRDRILALPTTYPWYGIADGIVSLAMAGSLADATLGADSYYARSMKTPPAWSRISRQTFADQWHVFFDTRDAQIRNVSARSADDLNAQELAQLGTTA